MQVVPVASSLLAARLEVELLQRQRELHGVQRVALRMQRPSQGPLQHPYVTCLPHYKFAHGLVRDHNKSTVLTTHNQILLAITMTTGCKLSSWKHVCIQGGLHTTSSGVAQHDKSTNSTLAAGIKLSPQLKTTDCRPAGAAPSPGGCSPSPALPRQPTARARLASPVSKHTTVTATINNQNAADPVHATMPVTAPHARAPTKAIFKKRFTHLEVHELLRVRALLQAARAEECRQACARGPLSDPPDCRCALQSRAPWHTPPAARTVQRTLILLKVCPA